MNIYEHLQRKSLKEPALINYNLGERESGPAESALVTIACIDTPTTFSCSMCTATLCSCVKLIMFVFSTEKPRFWTISILSFHSWGHIGSFNHPPRN